MGKINRLDEHLSNMIAAGEVVERPSGVVKELVENSIDANATRIDISIIQGGITSISISDDGDGMDHEDATVAFERHATSKIKNVDDLWSISTMGFRGEALPSIAAVSKVLLRTNNGKESTEVCIHYGQLQYAKTIASPQGTTIEISNIFQKTPARFKHLKSPQYEFSLIQDVIQKFALAHPEISFLLTHDGKTIFKSRGSGNLQEVCMNIYGRDVVKNSIQLDGKDQDYHIYGYIMQPNFNRATKNYMLLYVNHRMIRNYHLQKAIADAYSPYMPKDRYPITVINIDMDTQLVDVNVHPSKWEIRLSKEKQLEKLIFDTITKLLKSQTQVVDVSLKKEKKKIEMPVLDFQYDNRNEDIINALGVNESFTYPIQEEKVEIEFPKEESKKIEKANIGYALPIQKEPIAKTKKEEVLIQKPITVTETKKVESKVIQEEKIQSSNQPKNKLPQLHVIGQLKRSYILAEGEEGLYIIDQHAAQERYNFERISKLILSNECPSQSLLIPLTISINPSYISRIDEINEALSHLGIQIELFGDQTCIVRNIPIWLKDMNEQSFIQDLLDIFQEERNIQIDKLRKHAIATLACHSSIRFHRTLTIEEMQKVIDQLHMCEQPFHCPHGRPTLICIKENELIHEFERG